MRKPEQPWRGLLKIALAAAAGFVLLRAGPSVGRYYLLERPGIEMRKCVEIGLSRSQVVSRLGKPSIVIRTAEEYRRYRDDASYSPPPTYPLDKEILVYHAAIDRMYVYIGEDDRVEHVHMART